MPHLRPHPRISESSTKTAMPRQSSANVSSEIAKSARSTSPKRTGSESQIGQIACTGAGTALTSSSSSQRNQETDPQQVKYPACPSARRVLSALLNGPLASVLDGCLKVRDQEEDRRGIKPHAEIPASQKSSKDTAGTSSSGNLATSLSDAEKEWLKKVESWKAEAHALVYDEKSSYDD